MDKCYEEGTKKSQALMDKTTQNWQLGKIRAWNLQVLKVLLSDSCL